MDWEWGGEGCVCGKRRECDPTTIHTNNVYSKHWFKSRYGDAISSKEQSKRLNRGMMRMYEKEERKRKTTVLARVSNHLTTADPSH